MTGWARLRADALHLLYRMHQSRGDLARALEAHVAYHEASRAFVDDRATLRYQALEARFRTEQLARERERERARGAAMEALANTDPLTGLPNRRFVDAHLDAVVLAARESGHAAAVALLDVDHFKAVNDQRSHAVGDAVLRALAHVLQAQLRSDDVVGRHGGEEFMLIFAQATAAEAGEACGRLLVAIRRHDWSTICPGLTISASIGVADSTVAQAPMEIVRAADAALYRAKAGGRDRVEIHASAADVPEQSRA